MSLSISHVVDSMDVGGAEMIVAALCRLQLNAGYHPSVECLAREGVIGAGLASEDIPVRVHGPASGLVLSARLYRTFRQTKPDVVHCHNAAATVWAAPAARVAGVKSVISTRHGLVAPPYALRREFKFVLAARFCDYVVGVCEQTRRNLAGMPLAPARKLVTVYNGANPPVSGPDAGPRRIGFTLVTVGRLNAAKDHATLFRAVALAREHIPSVSLWVVGGGELDASLRRIACELGIGNNVTFFGERRDVGTFLRNADLFVLSSVTEGLPMSLIEAMAEGVPAVVTGVGGMADLVSASGAGRIVPPSNPAALAASLVEAARDLRGLSEQALKARLYYRLHLTPERMAGDYLRLYESALAAHSEFPQRSTAARRRFDGTNHVGSP